MKARKGLVFLTVFFLVLSTFSLAKESPLPDPSYEGYVYDEAGVLGQETKDIIIQKAKRLDQKTGAQIVVAIIPSLKGEEIEDYSVRLFQHWKIGNKEDQGVLLLISMEDHKIRIETGYGLEGPLPDMVCAQIIDGMGPYFREGNPDQGVLYAFKELYTRTAEELGYEDTGEEIPLETREEYSSINMGRIITIIVLLIIFSNLFSGPRGPRRRRRRGFWIFPGGGFGGWSSGGGWPGGSSGGGWSGGGSGGFSGGGWSGGGGSSGGGGASGGW